MIYFLKKFQKQIVFILIFLLLFGLCTTIAIIYGIYFENIQEYYLYKKTHCNIEKLNDFVINATDEEINWFYAYINNFILYNPTNLDSISLNCLEYLSKIRFIPIFDIRIINSLFLALFIYLFLISLFIIWYFVKRYRYTKYKWYYWNFVRNYNFFVKKEEEVDKLL